MTKLHGLRWSNIQGILVYLRETIVANPSWPPVALRDHSRGGEAEFR